MTPDETKDWIKWGSHLPAILACTVESSSGMVVEMGVGHFSTIQLHALCGGMKRKLWSFDSSHEWLRFFDNRLHCEWHQFTCCPYNDAVKLLNGVYVGMCFIDHSDTLENRVEQFRVMSKQSEYVVVHDFHHENRTYIEPLLSDGNSHICTWYEPPTLVFSLNLPIPEGIKVL